MSERKKLVALRLDPKQILGLEEAKRRTGAPVSEQVRRAIDAWLATHGQTKSAPKRGRTRRGA